MLTVTERPNIIKVGDYKSITVHPLSGLIGAEIHGVDLNDPSEEQLSEIRRAFADHLVVVFRSQEGLTHKNHIRFSETFGPIQPIPHIKNRPDFKDIQLVHRDADDQKGVVGEAFHSDSTFMDTPPAVVVMRGVVVPPYGGDTAFGNLYLGYETLSEKMRQVIDGLRVVHSATRLFGSGADQRLYKSMKNMDTTEGDREVIHPLAMMHPVTGRKALFLNPLFSIRFEGMTEAESAPLLNFLHQYSSFTPFTVRVRWDAGTVVVWDNWAASHSAVGDYQGYARTLERVTLGGRIPH